MAETSGEVVMVPTPSGEVEAQRMGRAEAGPGRWCVGIPGDQRPSSATPRNWSRTSRGGSPRLRRSPPGTHGRSHRRAPPWPGPDRASLDADPCGGLSASGGGGGRYDAGASAQAAREKGQEGLSRLSGRDHRAVWAGQSAGYKLTVGIILAEDQEPAELRRWFSDQTDIREDPGIAEEILALIDQFGVRSVAMVDRIIGCPHEEGIDYEGPTCPHCPYWAGRDRWTGEIIH
jgi:hypothetical protein